MFAIVKRLGALATIAALAACGGGGGGSAVPSGTANNPVATYTGPATLANFTWGSNIMKNATYQGPATFKSMTLNVQMQLADSTGLLRYAHDVSTPGTSVYRQFLTPQQIGQRFGASQSTITAAAAYFAKYGLATGTWPQHLMMVVTGSQSQLEQAFGTKFGTYSAYGKTFVAPMQQPHFSTPVPVTNVVGIVHTSLERGYFIRGNNNQFGGYSPQQLRRAFDFTGAASAGYDGTGISVGIIGTGPIWSGDAPAVGAAYHTKVGTVTEIPAKAQPASAQNGNTGTGQFDDATGLASPPPVTGDQCASANPGASVFPRANCNPEDGEAQIDTEAISSLAPGASVLFYLAFNTKDCADIPGFCPTGAVGVQGLYLTDDEIQQAIADNTADVISISYGLPEPAGVGYYYDSTGNGPGPAEFAALVTEGIAVFASSGDNGAYQCVDGNTGYPTNQLCVSYPASDPSVVGVGAVNVPLDNTGNLLANASITSWGGNTTGGGDGFGDNSIGSAGGLSGVFLASQVPGQSTAGISILGGKRGVPDISMDGDPLTGPLVVQYANFPTESSFSFPGGGTSEAAPEMAAAWAVVLQACKQNPSSCGTGPSAHPYRLGNPNALFYSIYKSGNGTSYAQTMFDVLAGSNGANSGNPPSYQPGYSAGPGYDFVTGVGVPYIGHLINATFVNNGKTNPNVP